MSQSQTVPCPHCGASYQLTGEYLAQYCGQQTQCHQCGQAFLIPRPDELAIPFAMTDADSFAGSADAPRVLHYRGPDYRDPAIGVWRDGNRLVAVNGAVFPLRCVKCNGPSDGLPMVRKMYWHHPAFYCIILFNILAYLIVSFFVRKKGTVTLSLCREHRIRRRCIILFAGLSLPVGIAFFILAWPMNLPHIFVPLGIIFVIAGPAFGVIGSRIVTPTKIDGRYLWLKGAGSEFMQTL